jgi:hypothetical protein
MRTTVTLDADVAAAIQQLRRKEGIGVSEALNRLARGGLTVRDQPKRFRQRSYPMGPFTVDVTNVAEAIDLLEGPAHR